MFMPTVNYLQVVDCEYDTAKRAQLIVSVENRNEIVTKATSRNKSKLMKAFLYMNQLKQTSKDCKET